MKWKNEERIWRIYRLLEKEEITWFNYTNSLSITSIREVYFTFISSLYVKYFYFKGKNGRGFITLTQCGNQIRVRIHHFGIDDPPDSFYMIR